MDVNPFGPLLGTWGILVNPTVRKAGETLVVTATDPRGGHWFCSLHDGLSSDGSPAKGGRPM